MTIAEHEIPIEVPIRMDELGIPYVPLRPVPGMRSVATGYGDALTPGLRPRRRRTFSWRSQSR
jgi:hypothetical protein